MTINPSPLTAALAGVFSALAWPWVWSRFGANAGGDSLGLIVATLLVIALPAHALVVGFRRTADEGAGRVTAPCCGASAPGWSVPGPPRRCWR